MPYLCREIARRFAPRLYDQQKQPADSLLWSWYCVGALDSDVLIVYYPTWSSETHPNPVLNELYSNVRGSYYGLPLYDIEYISIRLDGVRGRMKAVEFQTAFVRDFDAYIVEHIICRLSIQGDTVAAITYYRTNGDVVHRRTVSCLSQTSVSVDLRITTWNHMLGLICNPDAASGRILIPPLRKLSVVEFDRYRFGRRSQPQPMNQP
ncbi:MAG: hypothetical protein JST22_04435 [Bacteroidetes bacterium]|nr:hypothetical protein [Bacteroidota bacterium]